EADDVERVGHQSSAPAFGAAFLAALADFLAFGVRSVLGLAGASPSIRSNRASRPLTIGSSSESRSPARTMRRPAAKKVLDRSMSTIPFESMSEASRTRAGRVIPARPSPATRYAVVATFRI